MRMDTSHADSSLTAARRSHFMRNVLKLPTIVYFPVKRGPWGQYVISSPIANGDTLPTESRRQCCPHTALQLQELG